MHIVIPCFLFAAFTDMDGLVEDFLESPSECGLDVCTKKQLLLIVKHY